MKKSNVYKKNTKKPRNWRLWFLSSLLILAALGLVWRMVQLTVIDRAFLQSQGDARTLRVVPIPAYRGMITDRNGQALAISTPVDAVWINPKQFVATPAQINTIATLLNIPFSDLNTRLKQNANRGFMYIKRQVDPTIAQQVLGLNLPGLYLKAEFRRYYPLGEAAAQLIGFTNIDDIGQSGMELAYNQWLQGIPGKKRVLKDRYGNIVQDIDVIREPTPGHNLVLSIDERIQYLAYSTLKEAVLKNKAAAGTIVVLDAQTGEALAMASVPSFNPNNRTDYNPGDYRNRAVTDMFEPGSTLKTFAIANAFASGKYQPSTIVDTSPGYMYLDGHKVSDDENNGKIDVTTIMQRSSNMGASKITLSLPNNSLPTLLSLVGFGTQTNSYFPGESPGDLPYRNYWPPFTLSTLAFGYGIAVTTLQLASAYQVFADGGVKYPVSLLKLDQPPQGRRILTTAVAQEVTQVLEAVIERGGTGTTGSVPDYRVAGKTGTTRIVGPHGYDPRRHNALFVGYAPASNPRIVIAIFVNDPQGVNYYGTAVAAPIFEKVMAGTLRILDIPPDAMGQPLQADLTPVTNVVVDPSKANFDD